MRVIVTYDITGDKRRAKLHRFLREFGINTQKSVFECDVSRDELKAIRRFGRARLDLAVDKLRIYHLCKRCYGNAEVQGRGIRITQLEYQIL